MTPPTTLYWLLGRDTAESILLSKVFEWQCRFATLVDGLETGRFGFIA